MFDAREAITEWVDGLMSLAKPLNRGDIIGHESIVALLGTEPHTAHWPLCIVKFKRRMEQERRISVWPVHGVGYRLCTIQEQLDLAHVRQVRARRQLRRGMKSLNALPQTGLTVRQRELRAIQIEALGKSHRELTSQIHAKLPTQQASPTLPRVRPNPAPAA